MTRLRITQSLLSSFDWVFRKDDGYDSFLKTLNREKEPPTEAMLDGIRFENCLNNVLTGVEIPKDHEWYTVITEMSAELQGAAQQVVLFSETDVDGQPFLLHGVLDYLREGHIWDCKFSKRYGSNGKMNKYLTSPQTPMYFALVPEALDFTYIISDGKYVYREKYPKDTILPIEPEIRQFMRFCKEHGLWKIFEENWSVAN